MALAGRLVLRGLPLAATLSLRVLAGSLATGMLLVLALPPHPWSALGWVALVPALLAVRGTRFVAGFVAGVGACLWASWLDAEGFLLRPSVLEGSPGWTYAGFALFGLITGVALGVYAASERLRVPWILAAWGILLEAALLVYLPAHLALSQYRSSTLLWLASWVGVWGVSFLVWLCNFWVAELLARARWRAAALAAAGFAALSVQLGRAEEGPLAIGMIQTRSVDLQELGEMNRSAGRQGAEIVVWPELAGSGSAAGGDTRELVRLAKEPGQPAFVTSFEDELQPKPRNTAALFQASGESSRYAKRRQFSAERFSRTPGDRAVAVPFREQSLALNICFDTCFPSTVRDSASLEGVGIILAPTQDPETPYGVIQAIHAAYTPFRAAETGVPIVRVDTTAWSMAVDSRGRVIAETGPGEGRVVVARVKPGRRWTLVSVLGDWVLFACGAIVVVTLLPWRRGTEGPPA